MRKKMYCRLGLLLSVCLCATVSQAAEPYRGLQAHGVFKDFKTLQQQGFLSKKPQVLRMDYNDVYALKKPLKVLNQQVILLSDEYMSEYVGCCVSEGWGAVIKKQQSLVQLQKFADDNQCSLTPFSLNENPDYYGFSTKKLSKGEYYELSCRERDLPEDERGL